jgi:SAM-dependent methyltransferase
MNNAIELFPANINNHSLTPEIFSARRLPDKIHYRMVKCKKCGLVRSDPIASPEVLQQLYQQSGFTYTREIANLRSTYGKSLAKLTLYGVQKNTLLEIGCGNGFFLEEAIEQGYKQVLGVEPSIGAVEQASPNIRQSIISKMMEPGLFNDAQMDVICMFQVLDHVVNPNQLIGECFKILKPGGFLLCINHNVTSWSAKLLREQSPIIDIEHTFLYSPETLSCLFEKMGFKVYRVGSINNYYSVQYLMRLLPLPAYIKTRLLKFLEASPFGHKQLSVPLGNMEIIAQKS